MSEEGQVLDDLVALAIEVAVGTQSLEEEVGEATDEEEERFKVDGDQGTD
jgi:hypothetical protein